MFSTNYQTFSVFFYIILAKNLLFMDSNARSAARRMRNGCAKVPLWRLQTVGMDAPKQRGGKVNYINLPRKLH